MHSVIALTIAALPLAVAPSHNGEEPKSADVSRVFDVSSLEVPGHGLYDLLENVQLLPLMGGEQRYEQNSVDEDLEGTEVRESATSLLTDYFDGDIDVIESGSQHSVHVVGTDRAMQAFENIIAFHEAALYGGPILEVIHFAAPDSAVKAEMTAEEMNALLASNARNVRRQRVDVPLDGRAAVIDTTTTSAAVGFDVEIAQGIAIHHAEVCDVITGSRLDLAVGPASNGLRVAYALRSLVPTQSAQRDPVRVRVLRGTDSGGLSRGAEAQWAEDFAVVGGVLGGDMNLVQGRYAVLEVAADDAESRCCAIGIVREARPLPPLELGDDLHVELIPRGGLGRPAFMPQSLLLDRTSSLGSHYSAIMEDAVLRGHLGFEENDLLPSALDRMEEFEERDLGAGKIIIVPGAAREELRARLALALGAGSTRLGVEVEASAMGKASARRAGFQVESGRGTCIVVGDESLAVRHTDVEVAQNSATTHPNVETHFQGLVLHGVFSKLADGRLAYRLRGQTTGDVEEFESNANGTGDSGLVGFRRQHHGLHTSGAVNATGDGSWTIVVGDTGGKGPSLTIRVKELR